MFNECPAYKKGRWYTGLIESTGTDYKITVVDYGIKNSVMSGNILMLPIDFIVTDYKIQLDNSPTSTTSSTMLEISKFEGGRHGITLPDASCFASMYVYVFGFFNR